MDEQVAELCEQGGRSCTRIRNRGVGPAAANPAGGGARHADRPSETNADGYATVPSEEDVPGRALGDDPEAPAAKPQPNPRRIKDPRAV